MTLIPCPECAAEVSDRAIACPKCGDPIAGTGPAVAVLQAEPGAEGPVDRAAALEREVQAYTALGYRVVERTETTAPLVRPKTFSLFWSVAWFLLFGVGFVVYLLYYLSKRDTTVYLTVNEADEVDVTLVGSGPTPRLSRWCGTCAAWRLATRRNCATCGKELQIATRTW